MPHDENDFADDAWDEYKWERFLREQDRTTEKYFSLLEKFANHPERDVLIAREMGWDSAAHEAELAEVEAGTWEEIEAELMREAEEDEFDVFTGSSAYKDSLRLQRWVMKWIECDPVLREHSEAMRFANCSAVCGAKLAAALCGNDITQIGMTIAYLKRGLKAANDALDALTKLVEDDSLNRRRAGTARRNVFLVRNQIVDHIRRFRAEWQKRYGRA
jgi:hypothetical protein